MGDSRTVNPDLNKSGVEFLLTELQTALTFMDIADTSRIPETVKRNHENAHKAYETVQRLMGYLIPNETQQALIVQRITQLKARLEAAGYEV